METKITVMTYKDLLRLKGKVKHIPDVVTSTSTFNLQDVLTAQSLEKFELLSPEDKARAIDKISAFDQIVKPNQKQENDITKKEDAWFDVLAETEYKVFYGDLMRSVTPAEYREAVQRELNI